MDHHEMEINPIPDKIGLCLSGGGYRAAGYHLGTLDYLDRIGFREKLTMLSTVSGGTFIGASYTVSLVDKTPFQNYFRDCFTYLRQSTYVETLLGLLGTEIPNQPGKRRNMIQAAAEMYATGFLSDVKTTEPYLFGKIIDAEIHLPTVIFNATCFFSGLNFRFQTGNASYVGTPFTPIPMEWARYIRLADIAAASSCFPGGFEPLAFPNDFVWPKDFGHQDPAPIALMDGGVADNVGLNSIRHACEQEHDDLDMIIASDVDHEPFDLYKDFPLKPNAPQFMQRESRIGLTLGSLNVILLVTAGVFVLSTISTGVLWWNYVSRAGFSLGDFIFYLIPVLLCGMVAGGILWVRRLFRTVLLDWFDDKMKRTRGDSWQTFKLISIGQALNMIKLRVTSIYAMTSDIFMRCIRKLVYDDCYSNARYSHRMVASLIYKLKLANYDPYLDPGEHEDLKEISRSVPSIRVIDAVADMNSTLWWENDYQLPCLVASGQITLCFSLIQHYVERYGLDENHFPRTENEDVRRLFARLAADWEKLSADPYCLIKERCPGLNDPPLVYPPDTKESE